MHKNMSKIFDFFLSQNRIFLGNSPNSPPPNRSPSIECPRIEKEYTANDGETWKIVEQGEIKAKDPEDGKLK